MQPFIRNEVIHIARTKFNVDKDTEKRTCDGIVFDSILEMKFYRDVVLPKKESGEITYYELQKKYILQDGFERNGKKVLPITYIADFYIEYSDGRVEVIDIKGCPDTTAKLKRKLFWYKYPDIDYQWITYVKKFGGWGNYDDFNKLRREIKRQREVEENKEEI
ncbi:MAG: DUF1064 domain-containing protein [Eubacteriales bacterium]|nr:DUF1064 domain-containing protein [Eubacteriales bacterium]